MSIEAVVRSSVLAPQGVEGNRRTLHVLTLSPFYPSQEDSAEGCFIAEPLQWTQWLGIRNEVLAVQPFYRGGRHSVESQIPVRWQKYLAFPGNAGLATAGEFLASTIESHIRNLARGGRINLIHAHSALPCGHAAYLLSRKLGIPFVVTVHGLDAFFIRQAGFFGSWSSRICRNVYQSSATLLCISGAVRAAVEKIAQVRTEVVYNGVDGTLFRPTAEPKTFTILSVGNLIPIKGHSLLLRAFARISSEFSECKLEIIGGGPEYGNLVRLADDLGIGSRVSFQGRKSRIEVAEAMRRCAVFALPSEFEGLGCVYLEAMASGKAVIACHGQGIAEIIQHGKNGILIPARDEAGLTASLRMLLNNPDFRQRLGAAARACVLERHTLAHQAQQLTAIYSRCAR
jgi:glycosyltransferase involved in cell wall biosynthesis